MSLVEMLRGSLRLTAVQPIRTDAPQAHPAWYDMGLSCISGGAQGPHPQDIDAELIALLHLQIGVRTTNSQKIYRANLARG